MPDLPDSTSTPTPPTSSPTWERLEGFRATFLLHFPLEDAEALHHVAQMLHGMVLDRPLDLALDKPGPWTRWELFAVLGDLQFIEDYLGSVFQEHKISSLSPEVEQLSRLAGGIAADLAPVVETLSKELETWHRKHGKRVSR